MRQVMGSPQVASEKVHVAGNLAQQDDLTFSRRKLALNLQLRGPTHSCDSPSRLTTRRVCFHCCFQDQEIWKVVCATISITKNLFEQLRLSYLIQQILVD